MVAVEINYLGIRKLFERENNQTGIDDLVYKYISAKTLSWDSLIGDPLIEGINLSEGFIDTHVSCKGALALLVGGAGPTDLLVDKVLSCNGKKFHKDNVIILYKKGFINFNRLLNYIFSTAYQFYGLKQIINDSAIYDKLSEEELSSVRDHLINDHLFMCEGDYYDYLQVAIKVLRKVPYCPRNILLIKKMRNYKYDLDASGKKYDYGFLYDFLREFMRGAKDINDLLEMFHTRSDYLYLMMCDLSPNVLFGEQVLNNVTAELVSKMGKGEIKRPAFTMYVFPELKSYQNNIYNAWVTNDRPVELDIYFTGGFSDPFPILKKTVDSEYFEGTFLSHFDSQDEKYIEALQDREKTPEKSFTIEPVDAGSTQG